MKNIFLIRERLQFIFFCLVFLSSLDLKAQENTKKTKISIGSFTSHQSESNILIENTIFEKIKLEFEGKNLRVNQVKASRNTNLQSAKESLDDFYIEGFYKKNPENKTITLYAQIYNPDSKLIIDAILETNNINEKLGYDNDEIKNKNILSEDKTISNFVKKILISVQSNPNKSEIRENINEKLLSKPIGKEIEFPVAKVDVEKKGKEALKELGEIEVVTASRRSQKISEAPSKVYAFSKDTIYERGYRTLTELLQDVPGFDFNSFNDSGEYPTDLLVRGVSDVGQTQLLVMENGIIQNDIGNGWIRHMQFDTVLIDVERIEIILGPGSALYGANAYSGLINIITKKGKSLFKKDNTNISASGRIGAGKNNTYMPEGMIAFKLPNDMIVHLAGRYYNTSGDRGANRPDPGNYFKNNYEPDRVQTSEYGVVNNDKTPFGTRKPLTDGYNNAAKDFFLRGSLSKDGFSLGFNLWDLKEGLGSYVPSYEYFTNTANTPYQKHHRGSFVNIAYDTNITDKLSSTSKVYYRNTTIMPDTGFEYTYRYQGIDFPGQGRAATFDKAKEYYGPSSMTGLQQQFNYALLKSNDLIVGFQADKFVRQSISDGVGGVSLGRRQQLQSNVVDSTWESQKQSVATVFYSTTLSGYIQDEQRLFGDKLSLTLGVRHDEDSDFRKIFTKRAAIIFKPIQWYHLKLLYGEAFKAPTVFQIYDEFRGNRNLQPQKIRTYEFVNSFFNTPKGNIKLGYFISQLEGLIAEGKNPDFNAVASRSTVFQNFKPTHIYGFSAETDYAFTKEVKVFGNYTITRDRDVKSQYDIQANGAGNILSVNPIYDGKEIDNIAERKLNLGVNLLFFKKLNLNLRMNWVGPRKAPITNKYFQPYDPNFIRSNYPYQIEGKPDGYMSGYTLLNATITYKDIFDIEGLDLQIIGRNILNKAYAGMGRQSGSAVRPIDSVQPTISNPNGFVSPYHPQPGREIYLQVAYSF